MKKTLTIKRGDKIKIGPFDCTVKYDYIAFDMGHYDNISKIRKVINLTLLHLHVYGYSSNGLFPVYKKYEHGARLALVLDFFLNGIEEVDLKVGKNWKRFSLKDYLIIDNLAINARSVTVSRDHVTTNYGDVIKIKDLEDGNYPSQICNYKVEVFGKSIKVGCTRIEKSTIKKIIEISKRKVKIPKKLI
jgi:hypothetical protein